MDLGLKRKTAVVSGSTAGIGLAIAAALASEGASVVVNGRTEARVAAAVEQIRQKVKDAQVRGVAGDLGTSDGVKAFLKQAPEGDVLVNNRVCRWRDGKMVLRWAAAAFLITESNFRRIMGCRDLWMLDAALLTSA